MVSEVKRAAALVRWSKPGASAKHSQAISGRKLNLSAEQHEQNRITTKRLWQDAEFRAKVIAANTKHGMKGTPTYGSWKTMRQRCLNTQHPKYPSYGGRGITICERWTEFAAFLMDMGMRPEGKTLDRIDNDGPYAAWNCRWATPMEQRHNQRPRAG